MECNYTTPENSFAPLVDFALTLRADIENYCISREETSVSLCNYFFNSIGFTSCIELPEEWPPTPFNPLKELESIDNGLIVPLPIEGGDVV
jgi:hypothetical protein